MRNAYEPPPWLAPLNTPMVQSVTGLGTGGGASVQTADSSGFGEIKVFPGSGASAAGSVSIVFPVAAPPAMFISADEGFGPVTQATVGNVITISWTAASLRPTSKSRGIQYEWATSA